MRDYEEFPDTLSLNSIFYIAASQNLTAEVLKKLHDWNLAQKQFFSLEKLIKGKEKAWVIFGDRNLPKHFPELNLVELEDYITDSISLLSEAEREKRVDVNQTLSWLIEPKNNSKKPLHVSDDLKNLEVESNQRVFLQAVLMPVEKNNEAVFQGTLRVMVSDADPIKKVELAKKINLTLSSATGLNKHEDAFPESKKFESFKLRTLIPKEVSEFYLTNNEVLELLS